MFSVFRSTFDVRSLALVLASHYIALLDRVITVCCNDSTRGHAKPLSPWSFFQSPALTAAACVPTWQHLNTQHVNANSDFPVGLTDLDHDAPPWPPASAEQPPKVRRGQRRTRGESCPPASVGAARTGRAWAAGSSRGTRADWSLVCLRCVCGLGLWDCYHGYSHLPLSSTS